MEEKCLLLSPFFRTPHGDHRRSRHARGPWIHHKPHLHRRVQSCASAGPRVVPQRRGTYEKEAEPIVPMCVSRARHRLYPFFFPLSHRTGRGMIYRGLFSHPRSFPRACSSQTWQLINSGLMGGRRRRVQQRTAMSRGWQRGWEALKGV